MKRRRVNVDGKSGRGHKELANEKRGGLKVVSFDRSQFKLFTMKFSKNSVQTPCERSKTAQGSLFMSFKIKNCFLKKAAQCRRCMKKSGKLASHVVNSEDAIHSLPTVQISLGIVALFKKIL